VRGTSLLGRAVVVDHVRVGRVSGVLIHDADAVVGVAVEPIGGGTAGFLPWPAARLEESRVVSAPRHAMLDAAEAAFYLRSGARWLTREARRGQSASRAAAELREVRPRPLDAALGVGERVP